jgi:hypothetical protein
VNARRIALWLLAIAPLALRAADAPANAIKLPDFPLPKFATNSYGQVEQVSVIRLLRELHRGGVHGSDHFDAADSEYVVVASASLGLLSAWLEAACKAGNIQLPLARLRPYDGTVYAGLLESATHIAAARQTKRAFAIPLGVMICKRTKPWGALPGDGERDAYVVLATENGFVVFDPPTRQTALLADFPNNSEVLKIRL